MRARVIVNLGGGTLPSGGPTAIAEAFERAGVAAEICACPPTDIGSAFAEAATARGIDAVVAAGGDGTANAAAAALAGRKRPLGLVPLGTLNHLARDAGIPSGLDEAAAIVA